MDLDQREVSMQVSVKIRCTSLGGLYQELMCWSKLAGYVDFFNKAGHIQHSSAYDELRAE